MAARLEIARRLFADGKVKAILVSGDHMDWGYNEPGAMFQWLVDRGVPSQQIALDHAGFDTYDSCARAQEVFGVTAAIVVTQTYHLDRAVALCRQLGVDASGVGDDSVRIYREPWRNSVVRERGAVVKALTDVVSGRDPVFLGPHETSVEAALRGLRWCPPAGPTRGAGTGTASSATPPNGISARPCRCRTWPMPSR